MTRRRLPLGIQTLRKIREDGCYYVDKTAYAARLVDIARYKGGTTPACSTRTSRRCGWT